MVFCKEMNLVRDFIQKCSTVCQGSKLRAHGSKWGQGRWRGREVGNLKFVKELSLG